MARIIFDEDKNKLVAEIYHTGYKDGVAAAKPSVKEPYEDAISRQAAKRALEDRLIELHKRHDDKKYETNYCLNTILELPSVTVQEKAEGWIPVSERLPTKEEYIANNGLFIVSDGNRNYAEYFDIYDSKKFGELIVFGFRVDKCVIAWMPLPVKPYKAESEE